jgi:hypothetical protein
MVKYSIAKFASEGNGKVVANGEHYVTPNRVHIVRVGSWPFCIYFIVIFASYRCLSQVMMFVQSSKYIS